MIDRDKVRRILIVALDNLGDLVFASALAPELHRAFPQADIDVWSKAYTAPIARLLPHVRTVIGADPFWAVPRHLAKPAALPFLRSILAVRRQKYDVALVTGSPWRTAAAVAAAGIPIRIGLARHHNRRFLTHVLPAEDARRPVLQEHARLLAPLGVSSAEPRYVLDAARIADVRNALRRELPERFIAMHPFASERNRCVPLPEWTQLSFALAARGFPAVWVGTTRELDELRTSYTHPPGFYVDRLGGGASGGALDVSAAALSLAAAFAGHDSGPLHIAGAFGVPVVGVYAPGQPQRTFPQGMGPSRMIARPSPDGISSGMILRELEGLGLFYRG